MSDEIFNQQNNLSINRNGGYYINGASYDHATKLRVASAYLSAQRQCDGRPNISASQENVESIGISSSKLRKSFTPSAQRCIHPMFAGIEMHP
mmetsp:Transcript_13248/g.16878  ORF Transcript_13248/g.16878 Transcript_13248/m.16878 type:complete len:93 (+) Transcript_13248:107-385(+)